MSFGAAPQVGRVLRCVTAAAGRVRCCRGKTVKSHHPRAATRPARPASGRKTSGGFRIRSKPLVDATGIGIGVGLPLGVGD